MILNILFVYNVLFYMVTKLFFVNSQSPHTDIVSWGKKLKNFCPWKYVEDVFQNSSRHGITIISCCWKWREFQWKRTLEWSPFSAWCKVFVEFFVWVGVIFKVPSLFNHICWTFKFCRYILLSWDMINMYHYKNLFGLSKILMFFSMSNRLGDKNI